MCASMDDSGNFMLLDGDKKPIWQTFTEPTDTILPGQTLNMGQNLTARFSRESYGDGRFQLHLQPDGNLVLYTLTTPTGDGSRRAYWDTGTMTNNSQLVFNENGYIYITNSNRRVYNLTKEAAGSSQDFYHMARIDYDGVFRQYNRRKIKTCGLEWSVMTKFPADICSAIVTDVGSGACGYNSICVEVNDEPDCLCPENFSYMDDATNLGCRPNFELPSCRLNGWESNFELVEFIKYTNTDWPQDDYDLQIGSGVDLFTCEQLCLKDCFCTVVIHNGNRCWKKKYPLSNGRRGPNVNRTALMKVPKINVTQLYLESLRQNNKDQSTTVLIFSVFLGSSVFINIVMTLGICIAIYFWYHNSVAFGLEDQEEALMDWVYACYCNKTLDKLVENDEDARNDMKRLERLVMVAIWCIQEDASLRPTMKKVTQMLEGVVDVSVPPRPSIYCSTT
ncbi:hypothetical protein OIU74_001817 [Salix koriyanagi]|uniref:Bulb-type lectin domain-containing protein n=1 Tax=Salix koriyanagi TaxID=2511006 RepID=A0A9Q1ANM7_9ROSI|nr:hypothetical protein OIU74_001817 [Salix koriyanagi]